MNENSAGGQPETPFNMLEPVEVAFELLRLTAEPGVSVSLLPTRLAEGTSALVVATRTPPRSAALPAAAPRMTVQQVDSGVGMINAERHGQATSDRQSSTCTTRG
jgi:hypothetical protein